MLLSPAKEAKNNFQPGSEFVHQGTGFNLLQIPRQKILRRKYADRSFPTLRFKLFLAIVMLSCASISMNAAVSLKGRSQTLLQVQRCGS